MHKGVVIVELNICMHICHWCCHPSCATSSTRCLLGVTFPPDNWIHPALGKFQTNLRNAETQIALDRALGTELLVVPSCALCASSNGLTSFVARLLDLVEICRRRAPTSALCNLHGTNCHLLGRGQRLWVQLLQICTKLGSTLEGNSTLYIGCGSLPKAH